MAAPIGNWQKELEDLLKNIQITNDCHRLRTCRKDIELLENLMKLNLIDGIPWVSAYFESCHRLNEKSTDKTFRGRQDGNKCFQKKQYKEAASYYTQAILNAPGQTQELALAFGNRSATLFHLSVYKDCLTDINEAIHQGFPEHMKYKLLVRKLHCLRNLGFTEQYKKCQPEARKAVEASDCDRKKKDQLLKEIKELEMKTLKSSNVTEEVDTQTMPSVSHGNGPVLVQASDSVSLQCNDQQGRFLTATQVIKTGDTLIVEKPFAAVLLPEHYETHCHHCFVKHTHSFPCRRCSLVRYCSPGCASDSWESYHRVECPYLKLLHSVGIAHLSLRIVVVAGLDFLTDFRCQQASTLSDQRVPGLDSNGQYRRNYQTVYDLMTHAEDMETEDLLQYAMTALLLLRILQHSGWFNKTSPDPVALVPESSKLQSPDKDRSHPGRQETESGNTNCDHSVESSVLKDDTEDNVNTGAYGGRSYNKTADSKSEHTIGSNAIQATQEHSEENSDKDHSIKVVNSEDRMKKLVIGANRDIDGSFPTAYGMKCEITEAIEKGDETVVDTEQAANEDLEVYVGQLLLRHIQQLVCNAHAITELQCSQAVVGSAIEDLSQVRVATAIYPTASLMNHSCDPIIISSFHKDVLVVRAVRDVPKGGEIFNCYGPHHKRMSRSERQRSLREQYFFTCTCQPCVEGETAEAFLFTSVGIRIRCSCVLQSYKCPSCSGALVPVKPGSYICQRCDHRTPRMDTVKADHATELFQKGLALLQQNRVEEAVSIMKKCCKLRTSLLYKHNKDLSETQDCLARCFAMMGQFREAAVYLTASVETVKVIYGKDSIETANELQKLSEILISAQDWREALSVTQEAVKLFTVHYGKGNDKVKELTSAMEQLMDIVGK